MINKRSEHELKAEAEVFSRAWAAGMQAFGQNSNITDEARITAAKNSTKAAIKLWHEIQSELCK